ncbi:LRB3B protein, partial [Odontophorus gujanensis]|nr:LRB3B protein [Odontophorus gujanensis]
GTNTVSLAGWWLVSASGARPLPQPSLSLHPSQWVNMGDTVTLRCHVSRPAAWVEFYQDEHLRLHKRKEEGLDTSEFSFVITEMKHAVKYRCRYRALQPPGTSEKSDPVELVVTGEGTGDTTQPWAVPTGPHP